MERTAWRPWKIRFPAKFQSTTKLETNRKPYKNPKWIVQICLSFIISLLLIQWFIRLLVIGHASIHPYIYPSIHPFIHSSIHSFILSRHVRIVLHNFKLTMKWTETKSDNNSHETTRNSWLKSLIIFQMEFYNLCLRYEIARWEGGLPILKCRGWSVCCQYCCVWKVRINISRV
jgi:hypothetical protein